MHRSAFLKQKILNAIRDNPFITQEDLAGQLELSRSAVANYISLLTKEGAITGRAYVLPQPNRIVCIGGANIDRKMTPLSKLQFGTSNPVHVTQSYGGVARNIAENLGRMGCMVALVTMVGNDQEGKGLVSYCSTYHVDTSHIFKIEEERTGTYTAILDQNGDMVLAMADMQIYDRFTVEKIQNRWMAIASSSFTAADTNLPAETLAYLIQKARENHIRLCIIGVSRPKAERLPSRLDGIFLSIVNQGEAEVISGVEISGESRLMDAGRAIIDKGCLNVIITCGEKGVFWMSHSGKYAFMEALPAQVVDVTGAGDSFTAGVLFALQSDADDLQRASWLGMKVSSMTLRTASTVSDEIHAQLMEQWLLEWENTHQSKKKKGR